MFQIKDPPIAIKPWVPTLFLQKQCVMNVIELIFLFAFSSVIGYLISIPNIGLLMMLLLLPTKSGNQGEISN